MHRTDFVEAAVGVSWLEGVHKLAGAIGNDALDALKTLLIEHEFEAGIGQGRFASPVQGTAFDDDVLVAEGIDGADIRDFAQISRVQKRNRAFGPSSSNENLVFLTAVVAQGIHF